MSFEDIGSREMDFYKWAVYDGGRSNWVESAGRNWDDFG